MILQEIIINSSTSFPDAVAVLDSDTHITYQELDQRADSFAHALRSCGIVPGDRVGIWLEKSAQAIAAMQAALRVGAIYVPLDPLSPAARISTILQNCKMRVLVTTRRRLESLQAQVADFSALDCICLDSPASNHAMRNAPPVQDGSFPKHIPEDFDIAYILYTSGSTGTPKGVCISHRNAMAFIEWAAETLQAGPGDRLANHAPFHFDLSVLDLYVAFSAGATVCLIPDNISYMPAQLVKMLVQEALTIWYSVPSVLILMIERAQLLEQELPALRVLAYAGEPFPIKHLRRLYQHLPDTRFFNLYGPTETNVCTAYEVRHIPAEQARSVPIGQASSGDTVWAQKDDGTVAGPGETGELMVAGPTVMVGYWGQARPENQPYATGDLVKLLDDGNYEYVGRRDHMAKVRGYRIEIGDIEAALATHPAIQETAVIVAGSGMEARLVAFTVSSTTTPLALLDIKRHCAERLPRYMIVDTVRTLPVLPRTRNGKIDRIKLKDLESMLSKTNEGEAQHAKSGSY